MSLQHACPCGSGDDFSRCCEPCLKGAALAKTAEQLMRCRYTAYVLHDAAYLLACWHDSTRPPQLDLLSEPVNWIGLKIISTQAGQTDDHEGTVEFIARYKLNGKAYRLHERSRFIREQERWFYVGGGVNT